MTSGPPIIYIVDDDLSFRTSMDRMLRGAGYRVSSSKSADQLLANPPNPERGCILLDLQMPGLGGLQLQDYLSKLGSALPILFISGHADISASVRAMKAGADDFLTKPVDKAILLAAIERALVRYDESQEQRSRRSHLMALSATLSPRERMVFSLVVRGWMNKQIAHELGISERTIKAHRHSLMEKFQAKSVAELVSIAAQTGVPTA